MDVHTEVVQGHRTDEHGYGAVVSLLLMAVYFTRTRSCSFHGSHYNGERTLRTPRRPFRWRYSNRGLWRGSTRSVPLADVQLMERVDLNAGTTLGIILGTTVVGTFACVLGILFCEGLH